MVRGVREEGHRCRGVGLGVVRIRRERGRTMELAKW
jgi:hypothetical protein